MKNIYNLIYIPCIFLVIILLSMILKIIINDSGKIKLFNLKIEEEFINNCKKNKINV